MKDNHGIPLSEEELDLWESAFKDIEESIDLVMRNGIDL